MLVSQLRQLQADEIRFYVDPSQADLYAWTKDMLVQAAQECADPTHRGSDAYPNIYGCQPTLVTDAATGEQTAVTPSDWFQKLQTKWGELQSPEIPGLPTLDEEGFLDEGSFNYVDETAGVWYYCPPR